MAWTIRAEFRRAGRSLALLALGALAVTASASLVLAQDSTEVAGASVKVEATGGDVRAAGASVDISGSAASIQAAGAEVEINADASGTVHAVGARVGIRGSVGGDVWAASALIDLTADVKGDASLAGANVNLNGRIGGNTRAGAANVTIGPLSDIAGNLDAGGANVVMAGHVHGEARLGGASVRIIGQIDGPLTVAGEDIVITASARIGGSLTVYSRNAPTIADDAVITGGVNRVEAPEWSSRVPQWAWPFILAGVIVLGTILTGIVLMLFGGRTFAASVDRVRLNPVSSFFIGVITLILIFAISGILMSTIVGLSVGFALLLTVPILMIFGHAVAAGGIGAGVFVRSTGPIHGATAFLMLIIGAVIVAIICFIPWVGALAGAIVLTLGLGAFARTVGAKLRRPLPLPAAPAPPPAMAAAPPAPPPAPAPVQAAPPPPPPPPPPPAPATSAPPPQTPPAAPAAPAEPAKPASE